MTSLDVDVFKQFFSQFCDIYFFLRDVLSVEQITQVLHSHANSVFPEQEEPKVQGINMTTFFQDVPDPVELYAFFQVLRPFLEEYLGRGAYQLLEVSLV